MKKIAYILFLITFSLSSQIENESKKNKGNYYLEDQIYIGITYNTLQNKPNSMSLRGFSNMIFMGYIRDIPLNEKRNFGLGIGIGYSRDSYFHNIKITSENNQTIFENFSDIDSYSGNKMNFHSIEMPFEIRVRNSTIDKYKFWRIYTGVKLAYIVYSKAQFDLNGLQKVTNFDKVNKVQYGLSMSVGQGTWNAHIYYGLSKVFDDATFKETDSISTKSLKFGLIFYIL